jgi:phosphoribosylanthranilate isomerase
MRLNRVTITGADDSVKPEDLVKITERYPFVEWGILASKSQAGSPRFPSPSWISELVRIKRVPKLGPMELSLHVCGQWQRRILMGDRRVRTEIGDVDFAAFQRVQLNFHGEPQQQYRSGFHAMLAESPEKQWIFQVDGMNGHHLYDQYSEKHSNCARLFDLSHGTGIAPEEWPRASGTRLEYFGLAGGLGPDNLAEQLELMRPVVEDRRFWIDMETRVRSNGDQQFDLEKVERVLDIAKPLVSME